MRRHDVVDKTICNIYVLLPSHSIAAIFPIQRLTPQLHLKKYLSNNMLLILTLFLYILPMRIPSLVAS